MKKITLLCFVCLWQFIVIAQNNTTEPFSFVFINDVHLSPGKGVDGFEKAINYINKLNPDFVISCGDLVMDVNDQTETAADSLFDLYIKTSKQIKSAIYTGIGNHDIFGISLKQGITPDHPMFGKKMFEKKIGKTYQTFAHKGWRFFILDDIDISISKKYRGYVDSLQMEWIKNELKTINPQTPIIIALHMPLVSVLNQVERGGTAANSDASAVSNSRKLLDLFKGYNLKLVLQGHQHVYEDILFQNIRFITGGALSGWKWNALGSNRPPW